MANIFKPPQPISTNKFSLFLAGSIEMGVAVNWQDRIERELQELNINIFNPRRNDWDSSWVQSIDNPKFKEQVEWELFALENADLISFYFDPTTKSPISLLELGLFCRYKKIIVCCPNGFWRKGNVDIVCQRYKIVQVDSLDSLIKQSIAEAQTEHQEPQPQSQATSNS